MAVRLTSKGQVTVPKRVRDYLRLRPGSAVDFEVRPEGDVVLVRADKRPQNEESVFARLRRKHRYTMTTEEVMALTRGDD